MEPAILQTLIHSWISVSLMWPILTQMSIGCFLAMAFLIAFALRRTYDLKPLRIQGPATPATCFSDFFGLRHTIAAHLTPAERA